MIGITTGRTTIGGDPRIARAARRAGAGSFRHGARTPTQPVFRSGSGSGFRVDADRAAGRVGSGALLLAATLLASPCAQGQSLDDWIVRFGEAAAQQSASGQPGGSGSGGSGAAVPPAAAGPTSTAAASRPCGAALAPGELVLRSGSGANDCGIQQLTNAVRSATQAMNERRPARESAREAAREAARDSGRECDGDEACRRSLRTERLKEVSSLKHEEDQMAKTHNAPRNVTIPPAKKGGNWSWQTYTLGR